MRLEIDDSFFLEENREGFVVSETMKRAWAAQLQMLVTLDEICRRHDLRWWAEGGTLLGAVRHKGFIPWDDDIDISMPREDYMKLWPILQAELPDHYKIRCRYLDPPNELPWGCIINRRTADFGDSAEDAEITKLFFNSPYQHIVDIFPLDFVAADEQEMNIQYALYNTFYSLMFNMDTWEKYDMLEDLIKELETAAGITLPRERESLKKALWSLDLPLCSMYSREESRGITSMYFWTEGLDKPRLFQAYADTLHVPFEMISVNIPIGYDDILTGKYGDWRTPKKGGQQHNYPYFGEQIEAVRHISLARLIKRAEQLFAKGKLEEEQKLLEKGIEDLPDQYELYYLLAAAVAKTDVGYAKHCMEEALRLCDNEEHRVMIEQQMGQFDGIEAKARRV